MKYSEAIKIASQTSEFTRVYNMFKAAVEKQHISGSIQFSIGDEAFYFAGEAIYNESTNEYEYSYKGGKHTARRATYLINHDMTLRLD